jgi:murein L,D-transpeptidase YcbB/YkuD
MIRASLFKARSQSSPRALVTRIRALDGGRQSAFLLATCLLALVACNLAALGASAQEVSVVNAAPPSRIVIAPALTDIARAIKEKLNNDRRNQASDAQARYYFYGAKGFEPLWIEYAGGSDYTLSPKALDVIRTFADAASWGLDPTSYTIALDPRPSDPAGAAELELAITSATVLYAQDTFGGRIPPRSVSENLDMDRPRVDIRDLLERLAGTDSPGHALVALAPETAEFAELRRQLANVADATEAPEVIPAGDSIKPGDSNPRVASLRKRLGVSPPPESEEVYDDALVEAVKVFQSEYRLTPDGIVGSATRSALNRSGDLTRGQILANMEKWRWLPRDLGDFYVQVNIPEYRLWIKKAGEPVYETRVVVGTSKNQTPVFYDQIRHVVVNPYWNVPTSIARNEIGPQVLRDPGYLGRKQMELISDGKVIDPLSVDWSATRGFPYQVRQKPGSQNALGQVKFLFPNKHDVYLHDTPEKSLFEADLRAFSHGCVRVQSPMEFADALLANEPQLSARRLEAAFGPKEKWFNLETTVPVFLTYFTVRADSDGTVRSFDDIYGHDKRIIAALEGGQ